MIVKSLRWGYDGGGIACGPIDGNFIVEIIITDEKGCNWFVSDSRYDTFDQVAVSSLPLFDILIHMMDEDVDSDYELEKYRKTYSEMYDFEMSEVPPEMSQSRFAKAIQLVRGAMQYYVDHDGDDDCQTADEYIAPYLRGELNSMKLLELVMDEDGVWTVE